MRKLLWILMALATIAWFAYDGYRGYVKAQDIEWPPPGYHTVHFHSSNAPDDVRAVLGDKDVGRINFSQAFGRTFIKYQIIIAVEPQYCGSDGCTISVIQLDQHYRPIRLVWQGNAQQFAVSDDDSRVILVGENDDVAGTVIVKLR